MYHRSHISILDQSCTELGHDVSVYKKCVNINRH